MKLFAVRYDRQGTERRLAGDSDGAIRLYQKAIRHAPHWSVPWYNLGLTHKYIGNWAESYKCNAEAVRLNPSDEAAIWNMGIAATALRDWREARRAWALYKIEMPPGDGPLEMNLGSVPIRINPDADAEVVWAKRIDPARAVLTSIPLPESKHRHGDLVLHDGAPVGHRLSGGREVSVFNELAVLASSNTGTFEVTIAARTIEDLTDFEMACDVNGCHAEDWSTIRWLCKKCSEGSPHEHPEVPVEGDHRFAVAAAASAKVEKAIEGWLSKGHHRSASGLQVLVEPRTLQ